jgi:hypothetical protein
MPLNIKLLLQEVYYIVAYWILLSKNSFYKDLVQVKLYADYQD